MPATSKKQQKFMGIVRAIQKGEAPAGKFSKAAQKAAKSMKKSSVKKYAKTKHKGLPSKKEVMNKRVTVKEVSRWLKGLEEFRYRKIPMVDARRVASFINNGINEKGLPKSLIKKWEHAKYGREKHLANKYISELEKSVNENTEKAVKDMIKKRVIKKGQNNKDRVRAIGKWLDDHAPKFSAKYNDNWIRRIKMGRGGQVQDWWGDTMTMIKNRLGESVNEAVSPKGWNMSKKYISFIDREVKKLKKYHMQQNEEDFLEVANYIELQLKQMKKDLNESIKEADLGLTYKKGKTVKVKHKTSGKSLIIIDKPNVRKEYEKIGFFAEGSCGYGIDGKLGKEPAGPHLIKKKKKKVNEDVQDLKKVVKELENASKMHLAQSKRIQSHLDDMNVDEKVIKVSKKDDVPGNAMKMSGEEKIKKLVYSGSNGKGSYEIKGKNLNVNGIRPRDKGFFVRHFTMKTGFRKANLYYDGVNFMDKNKKF